MRVTVLGSGEAFDENLGNTSVLIQARTTVLLDCGYGAPFQLWHHDASPDLLDAVYISHAHADHYFGLPALFTRMWEEGRKKRLTLIGQKQVLDQIWQILDLGYPNMRQRFEFPVGMIEASPGHPAEFEEYRLRFAPSVHSVPNLAIRMETAGQVFCYSGDGMFTDQSRALFEGSGLLFHEAFSFDPSPVHGDIPSLIQMAEQINVKHLVLTHVQRRVRRNDQRLNNIQSTVPVSIASPGDVFEVPF